MIRGKRLGVKIRGVLLILLVAVHAVADDADYKQSLKSWKDTAKNVKSEYKTTKKTMKQQYKDGDITKPYYKEVMADLKPHTKGVLKNAKGMAKETKRGKTVMYDFDLGSSDMAFAADLLSEMASLGSPPLPALVRRAFVERPPMRDGSGASGSHHTHPLSHRP